MKSQTMRYAAATGCIVGLAALIVSCSSPTSSETKPSPIEKSAASKIMAGIDLTVLSSSAQSSAARGATISVIHVTKNVGTTTAITTQSKFYLCTSSTAAPGCYRNSQNLGSFVAGASKTLTNSQFIIPTDAALGTNYIIDVTGFLCADVNWANNTNSRPINITP